MDTHELTALLERDPEASQLLARALMPAIASIIRDDESEAGTTLRRAILDMLSEEVEIVVSCGTNDDTYSEGYGEPSSVSVSLEFGDHNISEPYQRARHALPSMRRLERRNLNTVEGSDYF